MRKTYIVTLDREFDFALAPKMKKGVSIEEGFARMRMFTGSDRAPSSRP